MNTTQETIKTVLTELKAETRQSVLQFVSAECYLKERGWVKFDYLYSAYKEWLKVTKNDALPATKIEFEEHISEIRSVKRVNSLWGDRVNGLNFKNNSYYKPKE